MNNRVFDKGAFRSYDPSSFGGLSLSQFDLLSTLDVLKERETVWLGGNLSRTLDAVERKGFAARVRRTEDGETFSRSYSHLTDAGREALTKAWKAFDRWEAKREAEAVKAQREEARRREIYDASTYFLSWEYVDPGHKHLTFAKCGFVYKILRIDGEGVLHKMGESAHRNLKWPTRDAYSKAWWSWDLMAIVARGDKSAKELSECVIGDAFKGLVKRW